MADAPEHRSYPIRDDEAQQPSDAYLSLATNTAVVLLDRTQLNPDTLKAYYWQERVATWLTSMQVVRARILEEEESSLRPSRARFVVARAEVDSLLERDAPADLDDLDALTYSDLERSFREDLDKEAPLPHLSAEVLALYEDLGRLAAQKANATDPEESAAITQRMAELTSAASAEAHEQVEAERDAIIRRAGLVVRFAWERERLIIFRGAVYRLADDPPDWLLHCLVYGWETASEEGTLSEHDPAGRPRPHTLAALSPAFSPQYTFAEAKAVAMAAADGPRLRHWTEIQGELALRHSAAKDSPLQIKFMYGPLAQWLARPATAEAQYEELRQMGLSAILTFHNVLGALLGDVQQVTVSLDDLIAASGMDPRSRAERLTMRKAVWRWLVVFSCWQVIGLRKGTYKDPETKQVQDLRTETPLFHIDERRYAVGEQLALDDSAAPVEVTLLRGAWLSRWAGDDRVLSYFGNVRKLAAIPGRQPSGAWARAICLTCFQLWREEASRVPLAHVGDDRALTARFRPYTRRELLETFTPDPSAEDILRGAHPRRARGYWKDAIDLLLNARLAGYYHEPPVPPIGRQGWAEAWLAQEVEIRPPSEGLHDIAVIATRAEAGRKARGRRRKAVP